MRQVPKFTEDEERDAIDNITNAMLSVGFLADISDFIFSTRRGDLTVGQFYDKWIKDARLKGEKPPLSPGVILGLMYVALVHGKERWDDIIPSVYIKETDEDWGIKNVDFKYPKERKPSLKDVVRRLRNALAHGNVKFIIPQGLKRKELFEKVKIQFHDENPREPSDTFDVILTLNEILKFIKKFQNFIHKHVRRKYGISR